MIPYIESLHVNLQKMSTVMANSNNKSAFDSGTSHVQSNMSKKRRREETDDPGPLRKIHMRNNFEDGRLSARYGIVPAASSYACRSIVRCLMRVRNRAIIYFQPVPDNTVLNNESDFEETSSEEVGREEEIIGGNEEVPANSIPGAFVDHLVFEKDDNAELSSVSSDWGSSDSDYEPPSSASSASRCSSDSDDSPDPSAEDHLPTTIRRLLGHDIARTEADVPSARLKPAPRPTKPLRSSHHPQRSQPQWPATPAPSTTTPLDCPRCTYIYPRSHPTCPICLTPNPPSPHVTTPPYTPDTLHGLTLLSFRHPPSSPPSSTYLSTGAAGAAHTLFPSGTPLPIPDDELAHLLQKRETQALVDLERLTQRRREEEEGRERGGVVEGVRTYYDELSGGERERIRGRIEMWHREREGIWEMRWRGREAEMEGEGDGDGMDEDIEGWEENWEM